MVNKCVCQDTQNHFFERAIQFLKMSEEQRELLLSSFRETRITVPVTLHRNGENTVRTFPGDRCRHLHLKRGHEFPKFN